MKNLVGSLLGAVWAPHKFDIEKHTFAGSSKRHYRKNGDMALIISGNLFTLTGSIPKKFGMIPAGILILVCLMIVSYIFF